MFTRRNNKAKCFQDCIVEKTKKSEKWMAWGLGETVGGWVTGGAGLDLSGIRRGWMCWWGGPWSENLKPFTLSCTPGSQSELKMSGQCGDRRLCSRIWFGVDKWIQRHTARGAQTKLAPVQNYKSTLLPSLWQPVVSVQLQGNRWLTQNEAVNVEIMHTTGLDREVYAQEETKEIDGVKKKKKPMHAYLI